jgi:hypothetical protein
MRQLVSCLYEAPSILNILGSLSLLTPPPSSMRVRDINTTLYWGQNTTLKSRESEI